MQIKLPFPCSNEDYEQRMAGAIAAAKAAGIDAIAYGDLCLADVSQAHLQSDGSTRGSHSARQSLTCFRIRCACSSQIHLQGIQLKQSVLQLP